MSNSCLSSRRTSVPRIFSSLTFALLFTGACSAHSEGEIGRIKKLSGTVSIERAGKTLPASIDVTLYQQDRIVTGADGSVGLLFSDNSRVAAGPDSVLSLDQFHFGGKAAENSFDMSLRQGTLSVISGKITEQKPGATRIKTPAAILAVRGTEVSVKVDGASQ